MDPNTIEPHSVNNAKQVAQTNTEPEHPNGPMDVVNSTQKIMINTIAYDTPREQPAVLSALIADNFALCFQISMLDGKETRKGYKTKPRATKIIKGLRQHLQILSSGSLVFYITLDKVSDTPTSSQFIRLQKHIVGSKYPFMAECKS